MYPCVNSYAPQHATPTAVHVVSALGVACAIRVYWNLNVGAEWDTVTQRRARASVIRTIGALLWPSVLLYMVPPEDHHRLALLLPLAWNAGMWSLDAFLLHHAPSDDPTQRPASLRLDPTSLTGMSFGLCSLLGARPDSRYTHLFLYAVVGCLVLVLPSHNLAPNSAEEQIFESVQKAALFWCIGLLIAGVALTRTSSHNTYTPCM